MQQMQVVRGVILLVKASAMPGVIVDVKDARGVREIVVQLVQVDAQEVLVALIKHKVPQPPHTPTVIRREKILELVLQGV